MVMVEQRNRAAVLAGVKDLSIKEVAMPGSPGPGQVLVEIKAVGICGSDVTYWQEGEIGPFKLDKPMIIGHESAGVVAAVGEGVTELAKGDRVALEPGVPCRSCAHCYGGTYNLCPDIEFFATPPVDGSLVNFVLHAADFCYKLPENVTLEEGALCEPLSVGVYACQRAGVKAGDSVAVFGSGPIGLVTMLAARAMGAETVVMTDVCDARCEMAKELGADATLNVKGMSEEDIVAAVKKLANGKLVDASFECCGMESATRPAMLCTRSGGSLALVGMHQAEMKLPILDVASREVDLKGIFRYRNTYKTCIQMIASGHIQAKALVTHRYKLDEVVDAFERARTGAGGAIKVMFNL